MHGWVWGLIFGCLIVVLATVIVRTPPGPALPPRQVQWPPPWRTYAEPPPQQSRESPIYNPFWNTGNDPFGTPVLP